MLAEHVAIRPPALWGKLIPMRGKQPMGYRNDWNFDAEPGDKVVDSDGVVYRLVESRGRNKRAAGELTPQRVKPPVLGARAVFYKGRWWWAVDNS